MSTDAKSVWEVRKISTERIELEPSLEACVETQARREYNRIAGELLRKGDEGNLAGKLEVLRLFLESADFKKLRSESEKHLAEGRKVRFEVYLDRGKPKYEMKVTGKG